jgi:hypothetical protein
MAINIGIGRTLPGFGVGIINDTYYHNYGVALSGTAQQSAGVLPPTGVNSGLFAVPFSTFKLRIKVYNGAGTSPTLTDITVTVTDGTNTVTVWSFHPGTAVTLSSTSWYDSGPLEFVVDTAASGSGGGAVGQLIAPVQSATTGAIQTITVKTTLGGTSPAATIDVDVTPLIPS